MDNLIWAVLPIVLLIILYVFIFTRKGEIKRTRVNVRRFDWITYAALSLGVGVLAPAVRAAGVQFPNVPWLLTLILAVGLIIIVRKARAGKPIFKIMGDERMEMVYAKSARNALFVTYLTLFVHPFFTDAYYTLDENWLIILLASGLVVLFASMLFYYYKGD